MKGQPFLIEHQRAHDQVHILAQMYEAACVETDLCAGAPIRLATSVLMHQRVARLSQVRDA